MPYRRAGTPNWWISYTSPEGHRVRETSGTASHKEAQALEAKRRLEAHRVKKWGEEPGRTFDALMAGYLTETADKISHERDLDSTRRLAEFFAGRLIGDLTADDIRGYRAHRKAPRDEIQANGQRYRPAKDGTISKELTLLGTAVNYACREWNWKLENPVKGRVGAQSKAAPKWLTVDEVERLRMAVRRSTHLMDFIDLGLATGMRCEEMLALEWRRVDFGTRIVWFDNVDQKSGIPGSIPLNQSALTVLRLRQEYRRKHCPKSDWVFCTKSGERLQWIKKTFGRTAARAKVKASPHSLRHTFASRLVQAGVPLRTVKDLCRHADVRTTMRYAFLAPDNGREAVEVLDRFVASQAQRIRAVSREAKAATFRE